MIIEGFPYEYSYLLLPIIGFIIALVGTMIGGGGGFFFFPILTLFYQVSAQTAVATSLLATIPICLTGVISYHRKGKLNLKVGVLLSIAGIIGGFIGVSLMRSFNSSSLKMAFGIYSILMALYLILKTKKDGHRKVESHAANYRQIAGSSGFGVSAGIVTGCFGTSGSAPILTALFGLGLPIKEVMGTSLFVVLINTVSAASIHLAVTDLSKPILLLISLGSVPGAFLGPILLSKRTIKKDNRSIKYLYAVIIFVIGLLMFLK